MAAASLWNPENIRDVGEAVGISSLNKEAVDSLARDVEFRLAMVIDEALKLMKHAKRTTLWTQDVSQALSVLGVEPLFGYESLRPLRFGEASIGPGQPLFYVDDEEVDFEKLINAPLPKVPREVSLTAHWLSIEGVQPSIPQNPSSADTRHQELLPKGPGANPNLAAASGYDNVAVKPLVKHILSKELQLYFERICTALLDESNDEYRHAALASLKSDPGLHQLIPYFFQFVSEKVTHNLQDLFILTQMMHTTNALLENPTLFRDANIGAVVPAILTCLVAKRLGNGSESDVKASYSLRDLASSLLVTIAQKYGKSSVSLKPRLVRTCLKTFLDPNKPLGTHYGAVSGLVGIAGSEGVKQLILPNLAFYDSILKEGLADESRKTDANMVAQILLKALAILARDYSALVGDPMQMDIDTDEAKTKARLTERIGEELAGKVCEMGSRPIIGVVLNVDFKV